MSSESMDMQLKRIRLELARTPVFPAGSPEYGYEFLAPLERIPLIWKHILHERNSVRILRR